MVRQTVSTLTATVLVLALLLALIGCHPFLPLPCVGSGEGECPAGMFCFHVDAVCDSPDAAGFCLSSPEVCSVVFSPVCGCDGLTYDNHCLAAAAEVSIAHTGSCEGLLCCDPATRPGANDNPPCIEGVTCCGDGQWRCNESGPTTTCDTVVSECSEVCRGIADIFCIDSRMFCKMNVGECCCDSQNVCQFPCDFQGVCVPRPEVCTEIFSPVCGCDGMTYSNDCMAAVVHVSIDHTGECGN